MSRLVRLLCIAVLLALPSAVLADANVTVVHAVFGTTLAADPAWPVDVYVDGVVAATDLQYRGWAGPLMIPAGDHVFDLYAVGTGPGSGTPVLTLPLTLADGDDVHVVAYLGAGPAAAITAFFDNTTPQVRNGRGGLVTPRRHRLTIRNVSLVPQILLSRIFASEDMTVGAGEGFSSDLSPASVRLTPVDPVTVTALNVRNYRLRLPNDKSVFVYLVGDPANDEGKVRFIVFNAPFPHP
jgi:hypothetical protein